MNYGERAYFDGDHCQHCVAWQEHNRLKRMRDRMAETVRYYKERTERQ